MRNRLFDDPDKVVNGLFATSMNTEPEKTIFKKIFVAGVLLWMIWALFVVSVIGCIGYVAYHFISKLW